MQLFIFHKSSDNNNIGKMYTCNTGKTYKNIYAKFKWCEKNVMHHNKRVFKTTTMLKIDIFKYE